MFTCIPFTYIQRKNMSLSKKDTAVLERAAWILQRSSLEGLPLINCIYDLAFSCGDYILDNIPEDALEQIVNGTASQDLKAMVLEDARLDSRGVLSINWLRSGDLLLNCYDTLFFCNGLFYRTDLPGLVPVECQEIELIIPEGIFAILRPVRSMGYRLTQPDPEVPEDVLTPKQQALAATAEAYWNRGSMYRIAEEPFNPDREAIRGEHRWQVEVNSPESCCENQRGYTSSAAFIYDTYYFGLNFRLPDNMYTAQRMAERAAENGIRVCQYKRRPGSVQSEAKKEQVEEKIMRCLRPGDIAVLSREDGSAHAVLYLGNGDMIHAGGKGYDWERGVCKDLPAVRRGKLRDYFFNPKATPEGDVFTVGEKLTVLRPLRLCRGRVPQSTRNRIRHLSGIVVQKHFTTYGFSSSMPGESVHVYCKIHNLNDTPVTVTMRERQIDRHGAYINFKETVTIDPHKTDFTDFYTWVSGDTPLCGTVELSATDINGVPVFCKPLDVAGCLGPAEMKCFSYNYSLYQQARNIPLDTVENINNYYEFVTKMENAVPFRDLHDLLFGPDGLFREHPTDTERTYWELNRESSYLNRVIPGNYGGRYVWSPEGENRRTRMPEPGVLFPGDMICGAKDGEEFIFFCRGDYTRIFRADKKFRGDSKLVADRVEWLLSADCFAMIRPARVRPFEEANLDAPPFM